jgi:ribosomal protein RSM22 (predicted rRNA methylase)
VRFRVCGGDGHVHQRLIPLRDKNLSRQVRRLERGDWWAGPPDQLD